MNENYPDLENRILILLEERYGCYSPEFDAFLKFTDEMSDPEHNPVLIAFEKALQSKNTENINKIFEEINNVLTLRDIAHQKKLEKPYASDPEHDLIEKEKENFKKMLKEKNITIGFESDMMEIYARKDGVNLGSIRLVGSPEHIIEIDLIKRFKDGEKGIGEIMIEWLVIFAYDNDKSFINLTAVPKTKSNVAVSADPSRLYKYYENIGFEKSNDSNKNSIIYTGDPKKILLKFSEKHKASGGWRRRITYKKQRGARRFSRKSHKNSYRR